MWPPHRWIRSIWIRENNGQYQFFVQTVGAQDEEKLDGFSYLVGEILKGSERILDEQAPGTKHKIKYTIQYDSTVPRDGGYQELMSARIFKEIAEKHEPWRLEDGQ
jgi:hypothetical protein